MTLCPIALIVGCRKCPLFALCPLKGFIGDSDYRNHEKIRESQDDKKSSGQDQEK